MQEPAAASHGPDPALMDNRRCPSEKLREWGVINGDTLGHFIRLHGCFLSTVFRKSNNASVGLSSGWPRSSLRVLWFLPSAGNAFAEMPAFYSGRRR
jgi:hypothetical protein